MNSVPTLEEQDSHDWQPGKDSQEWIHAQPLTTISECKGACIESALLVDKGHPTETITIMRNTGIEEEDGNYLSGPEPCEISNNVNLHMCGM